VARWKGARWLAKSVLVTLEWVLIYEKLRIWEVVHVCT
jgi:hypothetical protein